MNRPAVLWTLFAVCAALGLAALSGLSVSVVRLERSEAEATRHAFLEENIRLALWRLDSAVTPLLAQENARPLDDYTSNRRTPPVPSSFPGLDPPPDFSLSHIQLWQFDQVSLPGGKTSESVELTWRDFRTALGTETSSPAVLAQAQAPPQPPPDVMNLMQAPQQDVQQSVQFQEFRGSNEFQARNRAFMNYSNIDAQAQAAWPVTTTASLNLKSTASAPANPFGGPSTPAPAWTGDPWMKPVWLKGRLFLVREAEFGARPAFQVAAIDWESLHDWLQSQIGDLLPGAVLARADTESTADGSRRMAALPVRIVPAALPPLDLPLFTPLRLTLVVAWVFVFAALAVGAALLHGLLRLNERRAAFVSAVTHELRTPLTTFRMYTEMLASDMVREEAKKKTYLDTLHGEAERLNHLVDNVLAYARLERGSDGDRRHTLTVGNLLDRAGERLAPRARQAGMELDLHFDDAASERWVHTDPAAVEQILFNLVDNACKYAAAAKDRRIHLVVEAVDSHIAIRIHDHGPGIAPDLQGRLFHPFSKSAKEAAQTAPGVGLGLALSRRLARALGGDLRLEPSTGPGATFLLRIPTAARPPTTDGHR